MTRHLLPVIAAVLLGATSLVAVTHPVTAAQPIVSDEHFDVEFLYDCGSFVLIERATVVRRTTVFVDAAGNPVRALSHEDFVGVFINPDTGETFRDIAHTSAVFDNATGEFTITGSFTNLTVPGEGTVLRGVGRITFDASGQVVFEAREQEATKAFAHSFEAFIAAVRAALAS
jgi:hypothetical protein